MKHIGLLSTLLLSLWLAFLPVKAQTSQPLILTMNADGPIEPAMQEYFERGIQTAEGRNAEILIIQLSTPGGSLQSMGNIIQAIRASTVPVVIYVAPNGATAGSAGALLTLAAHAIAMAPEASIGAASPVDFTGGNLDTTLQQKIEEDTKATIRPLVEPRGPEATQLAQDMIDKATAVTASEALQVHLIDFIATDQQDLLRQLDGFTVQMPSGPRTLHTAGAAVETIDMSLIEQLLLILNDSNVVFILLALGVLALQIELSHPGTWVPGFVGVVCLALALYGLGLLSVNWFGLIFFVTAFVLFILDLKTPTHGALTAAGVASFIVGALVLFNSAGTPQFQRVSVPLVVGVGLAIGVMFATILTYAIRAQHNPIQMGIETYIGKTGTAKTDFGLTGQVQVGSELWTAEAVEGPGKIDKGDKVEVVEAKGLRLKVKKL